MRTFEQLQSKLDELRRQNTNLIPATGYGAAGAIASFATKSGTVQAECLSAISPGDAVVLARAGTGEWFAIGSSAQLKKVTVTQNRRNTSLNPQPSSIVALISGSIVYQNILNRSRSIYAFWLKDGRSIRRYNISFTSTFSDFSPNDYQARLLYLADKTAIVQLKTSSATVTGIGGSLANKTSYFERHLASQLPTPGSAAHEGVFNVFTLLIRNNAIVHIEAGFIGDENDAIAKQRIFSSFWDKYRGYVLAGLGSSDLSIESQEGYLAGTYESALTSLSNWQSYFTPPNTSIDDKGKKRVFRSPVQEQNGDRFTFLRFKDFFGANPSSFQSGSDRANLRLSFDALGADFGEAELASRNLITPDASVNLDQLKESSSDRVEARKGGDTDPTRSILYLRLESVRVG
jgi:hypothetical protein